MRWEQNGWTLRARALKNAISKSTRSTNTIKIYPVKIAELPQTPFSQDVSTYHFDLES